MGPWLVRVLGGGRPRGITLAVLSSEAFEEVEEVIGGLEGSPEGAVAFASGMAAGAALFSLVPRDGRLVMGATSYNTMLALARERAEAGDVELVEVDVADTDAVRAALPGAAWLHVESPTNPLIEVADLPALYAAARRAGVPVSVVSCNATGFLPELVELARA